MKRLIPIALAAAAFSTAANAELPVVGSLPVLNGVTPLPDLSALPIPTTLPALNLPGLNPGDLADVPEVVASVVSPGTAVVGQLAAPVYTVLGSDLIVNSMDALPPLPVDLPDNVLTAFIPAQLKN